MLKENKILIGKNKNGESSILLNKANRHGLITGASGSGKTITLKVLAESFSSAGVPVFFADVKGDLSGTCLPGESSEKLEERLKKLDISDFKYEAFPVTFWDVFGKNGHPIRTRIESVGPIILSRMLGLSDAQEGVLQIAFKFARENNYELDDLKDLKLLLQFLGDNRKELNFEYGNIAPQTIGSIQRNLLMLEESGGEYFFGIPEVDLNDFLKVDSNGKGYINDLYCVELFQKPALYSSFMLWLLYSFSNHLPEVGDLDKPKMVFFFDEAHLLFDDMPSYVRDTVIQTVKLIRSKGIGLYFISQNPTDIPGDILEQLGNRIQHTLRAYTPAEDKIIKVAAASFRTNNEFKTEDAIRELGTGEALVSFQDEDGIPTIVERVTILPPQSCMGAIDDGTRLMVMSRSDVKGKYEIKEERDSAYEHIQAWYQERDELIRQAEEAKEAEKRAKEEAKEEAKRLKEEEKARKEAAKPTESQKMMKRVANTAVSSVERKVINSIWKRIFK